MSKLLPPSLCFAGIPVSGLPAGPGKTLEKISNYLIFLTSSSKLTIYFNIYYELGRLGGCSVQEL